MVALSPHEFVFDGSVLHAFPQDRRVHYNHSLYFFFYQTARAVVNHNQQISNETLMGYANRIFESVIALYYERGIERPEPPEIWFSFTPDSIHPLGIAPLVTFCMTLIVFKWAQGISATPVFFP